MRKTLAFLLVLFLGLLWVVGAMAEAPASSAALEDAPSLSATCAANAAGQQVTFSYPEGLEIMQDGKFGTFVYTENGYINVSVLPEGETHIDDLLDRGWKEEQFTILSETLSVMSIHHDLPPGMREPVDYVEVGAILPDGLNVILLSTCLAGETEVYDLLLTVLSSLVEDVTPVGEWLDEVWIPLVTS